MNTQRHSLARIVIVADSDRQHDEWMCVVRNRIIPWPFLFRRMKEVSASLCESVVVDIMKSISNGVRENCVGTSAAGASSNRIAFVEDVLDSIQDLEPVRK